jgi:fructose-1,6-bisphosphatase/inositol monophosphatase family enzyme
MIALLVDGEPRVSVVAQPMVNRWTYAVRGLGAFVNGERAHITEPKKPNLRNAWVDMNMYGDASYESATYKSIDALVRSPLGARLVTRRAPHSAVALRLLESSAARGLQACVHDHNPEKPKQLPWDIVPIQLIVEEAGGVYMDTGRGIDARLDPFDLHGPILIGPRSICQYILNHLH